MFELSQEAVWIIFGVLLTAGMLLATIIGMALSGHFEDDGKDE
jgi:hypothetical protein